MWSNNTFLSILHGHYQQWGGKVRSSGHGGGEGMLQVRLVSFKSIPLLCIVRQLGENDS
jgi:hypothetical protein